MIIEIIITFLMAFCISITLSYKKFFDKVARNLNHFQKFLNNDNVSEEEIKKEFSNIMKDICK
mgnify:CR=1 FL=1